MQVQDGTSNYLVVTSFCFHSVGSLLLRGLFGPLAPYSNEDRRPRFQGTRSFWKRGLLTEATVLSNAMNDTINKGRTAPGLLSAGSQRCETSPMLQQGSSKELSACSLGATTPGRSTGRQTGEKLGTICRGSPSVDREDHVLPHPRVPEPGWLSLHSCPVAVAFVRWPSAHSRPADFARQLPTTAQPRSPSIKTELALIAISQLFVTDSAFSEAFDEPRGVTGESVLQCVHRGSPKILDRRLPDFPGNKNARLKPLKAAQSQGAM